MNSPKHNEYFNSITRYSVFKIRAGKGRSVSEDFAYVLEDHPNDTDDRKFIVNFDMFGGYYVFPEPNLFLEWLDKDSKRRSFHEVILEGQQKMRFDIDYPYTSSKEIKKEKLILEEFLLAIERGYNKILKIKTMREFDYQDLVVMENHREGKMSWHIVMPELWMRDSKSCLYFARKVKELVSDKKLAEYLDLQVYKSFQCFRMEGHGKFKPGSDSRSMSVLRQCDFEVRGRVYSHRRNWEDTLISWYTDDDLESVNLWWDEKTEKERKNVKEYVVLNKIDSGYNVNEKTAQKIFDMIDPNKFEHKGDQWRVFSRCMYNIYKSKEQWLRWCERYYKNNETENLNLWKRFRKTKARYGLPTLHRLLVEFGDCSTFSDSRQTVKTIIQELSADSNQNKYPLAGTTVEMQIPGNYILQYELSERGVRKLVRLNKNRALSDYYVSAMKAAAGGGYLLISALEKYYSMDERQKDKIHQTKPSIKNFYSVFKSTVVANRSEFDRAESSVAAIYREFEKLRDEYMIRKNSAEVLMIGGTKYIRSMSELPDSALNTDVIYIKSPTGSGKTQRMVKWLTDNPEKSCCMVTQRVSLADDLYVHYQKCGFEHYQQCEDVCDARRLIIQVESLHKLEGAEPFDVLMMDESESLILQFASKNIKKVNETRAMVKWLLEYSGQIVCLDAYMSESTVRTVRKFRDNLKNISGCDNSESISSCDNLKDFSNCHEIMFVNDTKTETGTVVKILHYYEQMISKIMKALAKKRNVAIAVNSIKKSKELYKLLTHEANEEYLGRKLNVGLYNSDHLEEYWGDLKNVNENWVKRDVIIYTSSIETGISFTKHHFDELYAYFTPESTNYISALQMLKRVRNLSCRKMSLYIKPKRMSKSDKIGEQEYDQLWEETVGRYLSEIPWEMDRYGKRIYPYKGPFYDLMMIIYKKESESREDYFNLILSELERVGCYVMITKDKRRELDDIVKKRAIPSYYDGFRKMVLRPLALVVKKEEIRDIKNANLSLLTAANSASGEKPVKDAKIHYAIQQCLESGVELTESQIEKYKDESTRRKLYNMKELNGSTKTEYVKIMKSRHIDKIKNNNGHLQPDLVLKSNNSLQCMLAYENVLLKLWPELRKKPFTLDLLESRPLTIEDIDRFRENNQDEINSMEIVFGIKKSRRLVDVKNYKKCPNRKVIGEINTILSYAYDIKIKSNDQKGKYNNYLLLHDHPKDLLNKKLKENQWDEDFIV